MPSSTKTNWKLIGIPIGGLLFIFLLLIIATLLGKLPKRRSSGMFGLHFSYMRALVNLMVHVATVTEETPLVEEENTPQQVVECPSGELVAAGGKNLSMAK